MITTGITSVRDHLTRPILETAARLGIKYYKLGYFLYDDMSLWKQTLASTRDEVASLGELNRELGIYGGFHNHAGPSVGGSLWDSWEMLQEVGNDRVGFYFDPAQATIEGGKNGWNIGLRRAAPRLTMIAIKDFIWEKTGGEWRTRWVPLGQGMVQWKPFVRVLREMSFAGPVSLHIEYDPGGQTQAMRFDNSIAAAARDLAVLKRMWKEAEA